MFGQHGECVHVCLFHVDIFEWDNVAVSVFGVLDFQLTLFVVKIFRVEKKRFCSL
jgi:hypothetical protein